MDLDSGPELVHGVVHALAGCVGDIAVGVGSLERRGGPVVALGDLGAMALLEDELLLGQEVVGVVRSSSQISLSRPSSVAVSKRR